MTTSSQCDSLGNIILLLFAVRSVYTNRKMYASTSRLLMICTIAMILSTAVILNKDFEEPGKQVSLKVLRNCDLVIELNRIVLNYDKFMSNEIGVDYENPWGLIGYLIFFETHIIRLHTFHPDTIILVLSIFNVLLDIGMLKFYWKQQRYNKIPSLFTLLFSVIRSAVFLYEFFSQYQLPDDFESFAALRSLQTFAYAFAIFSLED